jgi:hypothetical protein
MKRALGVATILLHLEIPPYPSVEGVAELLKTLEKTQPKALTAKAEDFIDARLIRAVWTT